MLGKLRISPWSSFASVAATAGSLGHVILGWWTTTRTPRTTSCVRSWNGFVAAVPRGHRLDQRPCLSGVHKLNLEQTELRGLGFGEPGVLTVRKERGERRGQVFHSLAREQPPLQEADFRRPGHLRACILAEQALRTIHERVAKCKELARWMSTQSDGPSMGVNGTGSQC